MGDEARRDALPGPRSATLWGFVAVATIALGSLGFFAFLGFDRGAVPPFSAGAAVEGPAPATARESGPLRLAGSGTNLPLTRALAEAFGTSGDAPTVIVHDSIGSTGGIRATLEGAIDVGLVSRDLREAERGGGLSVIPYARVAVVVAANPTVPEDDLSREELIEIYLGARDSWADGSPIRVLQREAGDSSHGVFDRMLPAFARANEEAYRARRWRVLYRDRAMQEALMTTAGAVGLFDRGAIVAQKLPIKALRLDGIAPSGENVLSGAYPFAKELSFVTLGPPGEDAARFFEFVASAEGRERIESLGYIPVTGEGTP